MLHHLEDLALLLFAAGNVVCHLDSVSGYARGGC